MMMVSCSMPDPATAREFVLGMQSGVRVVAALATLLGLGCSDSVMARSDCWASSRGGVRKRGVEAADCQALSLATLNLLSVAGVARKTVPPLLSLAGVTCRPGDGTGIGVTGIGGGGQNVTAQLTVSVRMATVESAVAAVAGMARMAGGFVSVAQSDRRMV
ncbi:hypothetical protein HaLaN_09876, partial [Haematococcus lacustris]